MMIQIYRILCLIGLWLSALSLHEHVLARAGLTASSFCKLGQNFDCSAVAKSDWSEVLGFPLASWGIAFYILLFIFGLAASREKLVGKQASAASFLLFSTLASLFSIFLFSVSYFSVGKLCPLCIGMYAVNFTLFIVSLKLCSGYGILKSYRYSLSSLVKIPLIIIGNNSDYSYAQRSLARLLLLLTGVVLFFSSIAEEYIKDIIVKPKIENKQLVELWKSQPFEDLKLNLSANAFADHIKGSPSAKIQIVEYSDFECPACRSFFKLMEKIYSAYPEQLSIVHKNFPLDQSCNPVIDQKFHEHACYLANYARCAGEQGKFWETADLIVELDSIDNRNSVLDPLAELENSSKLTDLDQLAVKECIESGRQLEIIKGDVNNAIDLKIEGTPTVWVNGRRFEGRSVQEFTELFEYILSQ